jgi:hypothetical protein
MAERYVRTAEGNGPVNALDTALREAISETYPHLRDIKLVNYKVRILDEWKATGAVTRVLLDASDGVDSWGAIGVHENVIEASWDALVDSLEAGMLPGREGHRRGQRGAPARERDDHRRDPARPAGPRRGGEQARARCAALGPALARPARARLRGGVRRSPRRPATPARSRPARGPAPRAAGGRGVRGRRGRHLAVLVRGLEPNVSLYETRARRCSPTSTR